MAKCLNCNADTDNPKFCSRSCGISFNNRGKRKHGQEPLVCPCGIKTASHSRKYCSRECVRRYKHKSTDDTMEFLGVAPSDGVAKAYHLRKYGNTCSVCGLSQWMGKDIPVVLDHINGNADDRSLSNYRLICCNCDAQTDTYKAKNKGKGRRNRHRYYNGRAY